jgi:hypothetical protein
MPSSAMLRRVALVRTDVSEESMASIIKVTRIGVIGTTLAVTSNLQSLVTANVLSSLILLTLITEVIRSSETSVLIRAILRIIPEDGIPSWHECPWGVHSLFIFTSSNYPVTYSM